MKKLIHIFVAVLGVLAAGGQFAHAQLATTTTTFSAAVPALTNGNLQQVCVASATGISVPSISAAGTELVASGEVMQVTAAGTSSTCFQVKRGQEGSSTNVAHSTTETVYVGNITTSSGSNSSPFGGALVRNVPRGTCTASLQYTLPVVYVGTANPAAYLTGHTFDCKNGTWQDTTPLPSLIVTGPAQVASAAATAAQAIDVVTGGAGSAQTATTGNGGAGAAVTETAGVGGAGGSSSGTGGTGGAITETAGAGGGTITGGTGGAVAITSGAGGNGSSAGGTGGALTVGSGAAGTGGTGTFGAVSVKQGATAILSGTTAGATTLASATSGQAVNITPAGAGLVAITNNSNALTLPSTAAGGLPLVIGCGATSGGTANCANTAVGGTAHIFTGVATLTSNAQVITFSPAYTSTATYQCVANDITTRANVVQMVSTSSSTATITNTTGASDAINYICVGY